MTQAIITKNASIDELTLPLGFKFDALIPEGLARDNVQLVKTSNSRRTRESPDMEARILDYFVKTAGENSFNAPRARYEGVSVVGDTLLIMYSEDWYATHFFTRNTVLPRERKGDPLSINGLLLTRDNKLPYGLRNPQTTDQGRTYHIVPAGFTDIQPITEGPVETAVRKALDEIGFRGTYITEDPHRAAEREFGEEILLQGRSRGIDTDSMRVIAVIYNSRKNFDTTMAITIPVSVYSSKIALNGAEHTQLEFADIARVDLTDKLFELSLAPDTNSGHFRGDIAALIAHRFGIDAMTESLHEVHTMLALYNK